MNDGPARSPSLRVFGRYLRGAIAVWTAGLALSLLWNVHQEQAEILEIARLEARAAYERDVIYRLGSVEGLGTGMARSPAGETDPHLVHLPDLAPSVQSLHTHITSQRPVNPKNSPDPWEARALLALSRGEAEFSSVEEFKGEKAVRLMRPLIMKAACVRCHAQHGYRVGDLRGGISVSIPLAPMWRASRDALLRLAFGHAALWAFGLGCLFVAGRHARAQARESERAWEALVREEEFSRAVLDTTAALVVVFDREGQIVRCNRAFETLTGYSSDESRGKTFWDLLLTPADRDEASRAFRQLVIGGFSGHHENVLLTKDGRERRVAWSDSALRDRSGDVAYVIGSGVDVTELRQAEEALRTSEERYRSLVENIDLGITLVGPDFTILMANSAQARLFGKPPSALVGQKCYSEFEQRESTCGFCPGSQVLEGRRPALVETEGVRHDGTRFPVRLRAFPLADADGEVGGFIEVVEDISDVKRAREEREQLEAKLQQAQKLEGLAVLAGGIAHDFNNVLMGLLGNADLALAKTPLDSPLRVYLERIETAARRGADLINQMLAYSGRGRFVVEPINLSRLVDEMGYLLETAVAKNATLRFELVPDLPSITADAAQLRQAVMNLATNASEALSGKDGVITLRTGVVDVDSEYLSRTYLDDHLTGGRYVFVEVADTGCGMDPETRGRIFDPFFTTKFAGRGLGLAAVIGIVRGHRGAIDLTSSPGEGACFRLLFPASDRALWGGMTRGLSEGARGGEEPARGKRAGAGSHACGDLDAE